MPLTLEEAKHISVSLIDDEKHPNVRRAGVVMLSPMIGGCSWQTEDVIKATNYKRNQVEKVICNLVRFGVWGTDTWCAEWPELFVTPMDETSEEKQERMVISFLLDAMVGAGELGRKQGERDEFLYWSL